MKVSTASAANTAGGTNASVREAPSGSSEICPTNRIADNRSKYVPIPATTSTSAIVHQPYGLDTSVPTPKPRQHSVPVAIRHDANTDPTKRANDKPEIIR